MKKSKHFRSLPKLSAQEVARLEYLLDGATDFARISDRAGFDFLSYLISLSQIEIIDILNYEAPARRGSFTGSPVSARQKLSE